DCKGPACPPAGRNGSRQRARSQRFDERENRRPERLSVPAKGYLGRDGIWRQLLCSDVCAEPRQGPVSPRHVYILETHGSAAGAEHTRRSRSGEMHGAPWHNEYAIAGPGADERPDLYRSFARFGRARFTRGRDHGCGPYPVCVPACDRSRSVAAGIKHSGGALQKGACALSIRQEQRAKTRGRGRIEGKLPGRSKPTGGMDAGDQYNSQHGRSDYKELRRSMEPIREQELIMTRRQLFGRTSKGIGVMALASLLNPELFAAEARDPKTGGLVGLPHFAPKAKRVIFLHQSGAPSQIDLFDY